MTALETPCTRERVIPIGIDDPTGLMREINRIPKEVEFAGKLVES